MFFRNLLFIAALYLAFNLIKMFLRSFSTYARNQKQERETQTAERTKYENAIDADFEEIKDP